MAKRVVIPEIINGFKIVKVLGNLKPGRAKSVIALCKVCLNEFEAVHDNLKSQKSCGCTQYRLTPLAGYINGFKIIKDLGTVKLNNQLKKKRRCIAECKKCGNRFEATVSSLRYQAACSCTHNLPEDIANNRRLLQIFLGMRSRCYNKHAENYPRYGGRGITICDEWIIDSYSFCRWALQNGYNDSLTIDRIDNEKGYFPDNCRWVTYLEQSKNKRKK